jgi:O-antigen/teichoic acid export membrane protein
MSTSPPELEGPLPESSRPPRRSVRLRTARASARSALRGRLARNTIWASLGYLTTLGTQGLYFVILARVLGASGLGAFGTGLAIAVALAPFSGVGSGNVLVRETVRHRAAYRTQLGAALGLIGLSAPVLLALAWAVTLVLGFHSISYVIVFVGLAELLFGRVVDLATQCYQSHEEVRTAARVGSSLSLARLAAVVVFVVLPIAHSATAWSIMYLGASALAATVMLRAMFARFGRPVWDRAALVPTARHGIFFSIGTASRNVYGDSDKIVLTRVQSLDVSGLYNAAYRVLNFAAVPIQAFAFSVGTRFYRAGARGDREVWDAARPTILPMILYGLASSVALVCISPLLPVVLGHDYASCAVMLRWLAVLPIIQAVHTVFGAALMGSNRQAARSLAQLAIAGVNIALNIVLISLWSWRGAVAATLLSELLLATALVGLLVRGARQPRSQPVHV